MKRLHPKEIENVSALEASERYRYFISKVADWTVMYSLNTPKGDIAISENDTSFLFPLWPFKAFAEASKRGVWADFNVSEITLDDFEEIYIPLIKSKKYLLNIFPVDSNSGFEVNIDEFLKDLREELEQYE